VNDITAIDLSSPSRRRRYPLAFKLQIVEASFAPGASIARVARENGLNANQLFNWRHLYRQGKLGPAPSQALLPVRVLPEPATTEPDAAQLELILPKGRLRICGRPDPNTLRLVIEALSAC